MSVFLVYDFKFSSIFKIMSNKSNSSLKNLNSFIKHIRDEIKSNRGSEESIAEINNMSINSDKAYGVRTRNDDKLAGKSNKERNLKETISLI